MRVAVASGKGGTGKSSLSVSLASHGEKQGRSVALYDCDVEEPNCHLLLPEGEVEESPIRVDVPVLSAPEACDECGRCGEVCRFNALASLRTKPLIFPELCHSCGGCLLACPGQCLSWGTHQPGVLRESRRGGVRLIQGVLNVGEAQATRVIRKVLETPAREELQIIDSPPGTSCSFMASVKAGDFILLVTEPTPFGLHDLDLALRAIAPLGIPYGIVENKAEEGVDLVKDFCRKEGHPLLLSLPYRRETAEAYSRGERPFSEPRLLEALMEKMEGARL